MRVGTWNADWASLRGRRGAPARDLIVAAECDVFVATEVVLDTLPDGHVVDAGEYWGYPPGPGARRKVALWSRSPWRDVEVVSEPPSILGRFVRAVTDTAAGPLTVVGVCVPWSWAHVRTGERRGRERWAEHLEYLGALGPALRDLTGPVVVAGDLNQRIPRTRQPEDAYEALMSALDGFEVATSGEHDGVKLIDHVVHSRDLGAVGPPEVLPAIDAGRSDHDGVVVELEAG